MDIDRSGVGTTSGCWVHKASSICIIFLCSHWICHELFSSNCICTDSKFLPLYIYLYHWRIIEWRHMICSLSLSLVLRSIQEKTLFMVMPPTTLTRNLTWPFSTPSPQPPWTYFLPLCSNAQVDANTGTDNVYSGVNLVTIQQAIEDLFIASVMNTGLQVVELWVQSDAYDLSDSSISMLIKKVLRPLTVTFDASEHLNSIPSAHLTLKLMSWFPVLNLI